MKIYNPNDYPIYHLLPPMIESETEMSKSPASLIEDMLKRIKALEDGGSTSSAAWGKITGNLSDQTDLNSKLNTKADKTSLDLKADKTEISAKADKAYVDASLESKANRSELNTYSTKSDLANGLSQKVDKSYVDSGLALKVDKTYVDSALSLKADKTYVDSGLSLKANNSDLSLKADTSTVETIKSKVETLETNKADSFTVDGTTVKMSEDRVLSAVGGSGGISKWGEITGNLSDQTDLNSKLNDKADKTALDLKADKAEITSYVSKTDLANGLSTKADKSYVDGQFENAHNSIQSFEEELLYKADKAELDYKANITYVDGQLAQKAQIIDYDTTTLSLDNIVGSTIPMLSVLNKFSRSVLSTTQFIGTTTGATNVLPYNKGIGIHTITENGGGENPYRLDSFEFSLQAFVHTENSNIVKYIIPLKDVIDGVRLTTASGTPNYWYSGGALSKSNFPNKTRVSLGNEDGLQFSLFLQSFESTPADHNFTVTFTLYIATPL